MLLQAFNVADGSRRLQELVGQGVGADGVAVSGMCVSVRDRYLQTTGNLKKKKKTN